MSTPRFALTITVPGTSYSYTWKLKTRLSHDKQRMLADLINDITSVDPNMMISKIDVDALAHEWQKNYDELLSKM